MMSRVPMRWSAEHLQRVPGSAGHLLRPRRRQADEDPPPPGDEEVLLHSRYIHVKNMNNFNSLFFLPLNEPK